MRALRLSACLLAHSVSWRGAAAAPGCAVARGPPRFGRQKTGHGGQLVERGRGVRGLCVCPRDRHGLWRDSSTHCAIPALLNDLIDEMIVFFWMLIFNST